MAKSIFDLLSDVTYTKVKWDDQTEHDQKQFSPYMINRFLSMDFHLIDLVNHIQQYSPVLGNEMTYNVYLDLLPKRKVFNKYIGNKSEKKQQKLITFLCKEYDLNEDEAEQILARADKQTIIAELTRYGLTDKQVKKEYNL
jgi:hypothetical protein